METYILTADSRSIQLEILEIPSPCSADWKAMDVVDGDRVRHCRHCAKEVFNLSAMTRDAAEQFVTDRLGCGGSICIQMTKRADGTVTTTDCKGKWRDSAMTWAKRWGGPVGAMMAVVLAFIGCDQTDPPVAGTLPAPVRTLAGSVALPTTAPTTQKDMVLGEVCAPPTRGTAMIRGKVAAPASMPSTPSTPSTEPSVD